MVIVNDSVTVTAQMIKEAHDADHLERLLESKMHNSICDKMKKELSEMALMDIEPQENGDFTVKASVVLDTQQNILTSLQMLSTKLYDSHNFDEEEVEAVLNIFTQSTEGF